MYHVLCRLPHVLRVTKIPSATMLRPCEKNGVLRLWSVECTIVVGDGSRQEDRWVEIIGRLALYELKSWDRLA